MIRIALLYTAAAVAETGGCLIGTGVILLGRYGAAVAGR